MKVQLYVLYNEDFCLTLYALIVCSFSKGHQTLLKRLLNAMRKMPEWSAKGHQLENVEGKASGREPSGGHEIWRWLDDL